LTTGEEELQAKNRRRATLLDDYADYLHRRWGEGCADAVVLAREITALGYRGSVRTVRTYLHPLRSGQPVPPPRAARPPTVREVTSWILRRPDTLSPDEQARLQQVLAQCPQLDSAAAHVAAFAEMMCGRHGDRLDAWTPGWPRSRPTPWFRCTASQAGCAATMTPSAPA